MALLLYILSGLNRLWLWFFDRFILYPLMKYVAPKLGVRFMNLGFWITDSDYHDQKLYHFLQETCFSDYETDRAHAQLYEKALSMHLDYPNFKDLEILEVSCGQGHSLELIERLHGPTKLLVGCDKVVVNSERNIVYGDAINLPFEDDSFDFVVNVEASHLYSDYPKFFQEVARVLKPGGVFCWMDIRYSFEIFPTQFAAEEAGLNLRRWESCNKEVIEGIKKVSKKYDEKLEKAPFYVKIFKNSLRDTYCAPGTEAYERLRTGKKKYLAAMWIKE